MESLIASSPLLLLFILMLAFKLSAHWSAFATLLATAFLVLFAPQDWWGLNVSDASAPVAEVVGWSMAEGCLKAIFPILLIILGAIFSYNVVVASGQIREIQAEIMSVAGSRGMLVLMTVWGFGGLLEGMAGFGTAVAIPTALLIGMGYKPVFSAVAALLANTVSTGFGALGVPVLTLCNEVAQSGVASPGEIGLISTMVVLQLLPLFILVPYAILMLTDRKLPWRKLGVAVWVGGITAAVQFICVRYLGAETPAILGSLASIAAIWVSRNWLGRAGASTKPDWSKAYKAWSVYGFVLLLVLVTGQALPGVEKILKSMAVTDLTLPVVGFKFRFAWFGNTALMLLLGSFTGGLVQGLGWKRLTEVLLKTCIELRYTTLTILSLLAMAALMHHSGMIGSMAEGLATATGPVYPLIAPLVGAIGTFVTGSDTSSNILFGKLQAQMATHPSLSTPLGPDWLIAANTSGATGGKMISPQSIAVATASCDVKGQDDTIMRKALPYALAYVALLGLIVFTVMKF